MDPVLQYTQTRLPAMLEWIEGLVRIESPTDNKRAVDQAVAYVADNLPKAGKVKLHREREYGNHLRIEFSPKAARGRKSASKQGGQVLGLGHLDTVWAMGTLDRMPCKREKGRLWGPGAFDMKAGVALLVFAAQALHELDIPFDGKYVVQLNSEEEIGSPTSRRHTEAEAKRSRTVFVAEPAFGPKGALKTGRKGGGGYTIRVVGRSAHAGLDFERGASAIVEIARQIERISAWTDLKSGITVNPGVISGGTRSNVVAEEAEAQVDVRTPRAVQARRLEKQFRALKPFDRRTRLIVDGGLRRPPLERTAKVARLYELAVKAGRELGVEVSEAQVGGGSDGNFTAALGVPTLDGLGAIGDGAHALHEHIVIDKLSGRAALLVKMIAAV
ncbi:MAG: M20 family metallopeptidase [Bryobacterales bacterium]